MNKFFDEPAIIDPSGMDLGGAKTAVITWSDHLFREIVSLYGAKEIGELPGCSVINMYELTLNGKRILACKSHVGAPATVGAVEEILASGVENLVAFGICGALTDIPTRNLVVPDKAYRDEGTSGFYAEKSDFVKVANCDRVAEHLTRSGASFTVGGVWTTDAFYRETRTRAEYMKARGCIAVDMECSALQTVCDFRGKNLYQFFITADSLAGDKWQPNYILDGNETPDRADVEAVKAAVELAAGLG